MRNLHGCYDCIGQSHYAASRRGAHRDGDIVDQGCGKLGLPQYRLYVESDEAQPVFIPSNPDPVVHYLGIAPGQSDAAEFVLRAVGSGQATLSASASFEVHLSYPGPGYWGGSSAGPLVITVTP